MAMDKGSNSSEVPEWKVEEAIAQEKATAQQIPCKVGVREAAVAQRPAIQPDAIC